MENFMAISSVGNEVADIENVIIGYDKLQS
jgi:hypothetical protein